MNSTAKVAELIGDQALRTWQVVDDASTGDIVRNGAVSRIDAPVDVVLPLLSSELQDNEIAVDLVVLSAEHANCDVSIQSLAPLLSGQTTGLLLLAGAVTSEQVQKIGLPSEPALHLPGFNAYQYPLSVQGPEQ